eukprot:TRINITY_DN548_c0_g1_i7.p2 TRINITY_DN548_c0_g1~~TRINITY_DN548_c0_g1_i7.p2  ORF type:complete len:294 (+),score=48.02 TRINITY_DN548_c0_g1_i7:117-998(+)
MDDADWGRGVPLSQGVLRQKVADWEAGIGAYAAASSSPPGLPPDRGQGPEGRGRTAEAPPTPGGSRKRDRSHAAVGSSGDDAAEPRAARLPKKAKAGASRGGTAGTPRGGADHDTGKAGTTTNTSCPPVQVESGPQQPPGTHPLSAAQPRRKKGAGKRPSQQDTPTGEVGTNATLRCPPVDPSLAIRTADHFAVRRDVSGAEGRAAAMAAEGAAIREAAATAAAAEAACLRCVCGGRLGDPAETDFSTPAYLRAFGPPWPCRSCGGQYPFGAGYRPCEACSGRVCGGCYRNTH